MSKYEIFQKKLKEFEIEDTYTKVITDLIRIEEFTNMFISGQGLPKNIKFKTTGTRLKLNQEGLRDLKTLPLNIVIDSYEQITDPSKIDEIKAYKKTHKQYPTEVKKKFDFLENETLFYDLNKPIFNEKIYEFTETLKYTDDELDALISIKTLELMNKSYNNQKFLVLVAVIFFLTFVYYLIGFISTR